MKNNANDYSDSEALIQMLSILGTPEMFSFIGSDVKKQSENTYKNSYETLGNGFELRPLEMVDNRNKYSHLYKDGKQVTSQIFRKGGLCHGFKDGYCGLILYTKERKTKGNTSGFSFGNNVIINELGEIKLQKNGIDYPYHCGGNVGSIDKVYYNLLTGEPIISKTASSMDSKNYIIVEHRYDFDCYTKEVKVPLGIYKIDKQTCELTKIDDIK